MSKAAAIKRTPEQWCDIGNAYLERIGRRDVHWVVRSGRANIEWKCAP